MEQHGALQDAWELARLLELVEERLKPGQAILEIGCGRGGTLWAWREAFPQHQVVGVDNRHQHREFDWKLDSHGAELLHADSQDPRTLWQVGAVLRARKVGFLHIDGNHREPAVRWDLNRYGSLVARGGLIALHDVNYHALESSHALDHRPLDSRKGAVRTYNCALEVDVVWRSLGGEKVEIINPNRYTPGFGVLLL